INGVITFKNSNLKNIVTRLSLNDIVLETDSPYLTPEPYRGQTNSSRYILNIALYVANLFNISLDELAKTTNNNVKQIFDI
ncbi:MAG: TatD family hydrolase, partial [Erysipelotrichaceae bacterium]